MLHFIINTVLVLFCLVGVVGLAFSVRAILQGIKEQKKLKTIKKAANIDETRL